MIPASTNGGGQCFAFPDVCKTPVGPSVVPIPYPNVAMNTQAKGGTCAKKVKICKKKAVVVGTEIAMSSGDEAGTAGGGVVSGKFKGPAKFLTGYQKVLIEGKVAAFLTSVTGQNGTAANIVGAQVAPSQTKVLYTPVPGMPPDATNLQGEPYQDPIEQLCELRASEYSEGAVDVEVVDEDGRPIPYAKIAIHLSGRGHVLRMRADEDGKAHVDGIDESQDFFVELLNDDKGVRIDG
jgi:hypothetical protein